MIANDVWETTTSTGTGNVTLAGAKNALSVTVSSRFATSEQFFYTYVDQATGDSEKGIGHLSASITLVRDSVIESTNSDALVSFAAGTKDVIIGSDLNTMGMPTPIWDLGSGSSDGLFISTHYGHENTSTTLTADRVYYYPFKPLTSDITRISISTQTAVGSTIYRIGVCPMDYITAEPLPGQMLAESGDITPVTNTQHIATVTAFKLDPRKWYYGIVLTDGANSVKAVGTSSGVQTCTPLGSLASTTSLPFTYMYENITPGWSALPTTVGTLVGSSNSFLGRFAMGK